MTLPSIATLVNNHRLSEGDTVHYYPPGQVDTRQWTIGDGPEPAVATMAMLTVAKVDHADGFTCTYSRSGGLLSQMPTVPAVHEHHPASRIHGIENLSDILGHGGLTGIAQLPIGDGFAEADGTDPNGDVQHANTVRAARTLVNAIAPLVDSTYNGSDEELRTVVGDLLCDLHHACDAIGLNWEAAVAHGDSHYQAEIRGQA